MCCDGPPDNQARRTRTAFAYVAWAAFGFVTGLHWAVLLCCVCATRRERFWAGMHLASYYVAIFMTAGGGGYVSDHLTGATRPSPPPRLPPPALLYLSLQVIIPS